ncbi:MAG TPA: DmsE family decaheme c-type cytochrome [Terriglobales bacterium]|nr:DmsE family decaheme c-type cytochrome [Terriglobales bacterium]
MTRTQILRRIALLLSLACFLGAAAARPDNDGSSPDNQTAAAAQPASAEDSTARDGDYVGSEVCVTCHADQQKSFVHTVMGNALAHAKSPLAARGCEACHGPGKAHVDAGGGRETILVDFTKESKTPVEEQNRACLACHNKGEQMFWMGSPHQSRAMACVNCHEVHYGSAAQQYEAFSEHTRYGAPLTEHVGVKKPQPELCLECHQMRRAQLQRSSHMPYREGKVTCTSCHNPHGTPNPSQLIQSSINENCYSCHAERRGPFLWEHPPVMENCANCHDPHGSSNPELLKVRMPRVCDSCHDSSRHPTQAQPLSSIKNFNRGCTNCHSLIHGSNHPSGNFFMR